MEKTLSCGCTLDVNEEQNYRTVVRVCDEHKELGDLAGQVRKINAEYLAKLGFSGMTIRVRGDAVDLILLE